MMQETDTASFETQNQYTGMETRSASEILRQANAQIITGIAALLTLAMVLALISFKPDFGGFGGRVLLIALMAFTLALISKVTLKGRGDFLTLALLTIGSIILGTSFFGISGPAIIVLFFPILVRPYLKVTRMLIIAATVLVALSLFLGRSLSGFLGAISNGAASSYDAALILCGGIAAALLLPSALSEARESAENFKKVKKAKAETLAAREQIDERTRFIAEMSHEIRTPLNAILGFSDTMREGVFGELNPQYKEYVELIHQSGTHLVDLVGDILDMSKIDAGRYVLAKKPLNLSKLASETAALYSGTAQKQGLKIETIAKHQTMINGDERAMRQVILNLLSNATKFTQSGGEIIVHVFENETSAWLEVTDNGRGMSPDELARISSPYMSSENPPPGARGTGLGLALVRRLTKMQGGEFDINSVLGKGTSITLEFPKIK